jgi:hypothetical protein
VLIAYYAPVTRSFEARSCRLAKRRDCAAAERAGEKIRDENRWISLDLPGERLDNSTLRFQPNRQPRFARQPVPTIVPCPFCKNRLKVDERYGREVFCPFCSRLFSVNVEADIREAKPHPIKPIDSNK